MKKLATVGSFIYCADEGGRLFGTCNLAEKFFFPTDAAELSDEIAKNVDRLSEQEKTILRSYDIVI